MTTEQQPYTHSTLHRHAETACLWGILLFGGGTLAHVAVGLMLVALALEWPVAVFLGLSILLGAAGAFFTPARSAFLRRLLEGHDLERAIALEGTVSFLLRLVAPPLMGLLLAFTPAGVGIQTAIALYLVGVVLLAPAFTV